MTLKKHIITTIITFIIWFIFVLFGLPSNYYQTLSFSGHVWLSIFVFFLVLPLTYIVLQQVWKRNYLKNSLWVAFYASVPLIIYDYIYIGLVKGLGYSYIFTHWYLTIFYFIVWIEIPLVGLVMQKGWQHCLIANKIKLKRFSLILAHAFVGWVLCGAIIGIGRNVTSLENTLIIHAISVPILFIIISLIYFKKFNYTTPLQTAIIFTAFIVFMDFFIVAILIEKSFEMFYSILGTWVPFFLVFISTYLTGVYSQTRIKLSTEKHKQPFKNKSKLE